VFLFIIKNEPSAKEVLMANKVNKKTRKREKQLKKVKQLIKVSDLSQKKKCTFVTICLILKFGLYCRKMSGCLNGLPNRSLREIRCYVVYDVDI
jgi:hypothetical protein